MKNSKKYFVKKGDGWRGPYYFFQLWWIALTGGIVSDTLIWNTGMDKYGEQRPEESIGVRQKAVSFPFMRRWMFHDCRELDKYFLGQRKHYGIEPLTEKENERFSTPIDTGKLLGSAMQKNIVPTFILLQEFACWQRYEIALSIKDVNGKTHSLTAPMHMLFKPGQGFCFQIYLAYKIELGSVLHMETYGLGKNLTLSKDERTLEVPEESVSEFETQYQRFPQILKGVFSRISVGKRGDFDGNYLRLILPGDGVNFNGPIGTVARSGTIKFELESLNITSSDILGLKMVTGVGYVEVKLGQRVYHFYKTTSKEIIIDSCQPEQLDDFKSNAQIIRTALAFLSGSFCGGYAFYFYSTMPEFNTVEAIYYEKENDAIVGKCKLIDSIQFSEYKRAIGEKNTSSMVPVDIFNRLCESMWTTVEIKRAVQLAVNGMGNTNPLQQAALYAVSLETLTNQLAKGKNAVLKPIADDELYNKINKAILDAIIPYEGQIPVDKLDIFKKKIATLNTPPNQDVLTKTFDAYGLTLSDDDKAAISTRNDYLHGRLPRKMKEVKQWRRNALHLYTLIGKLILKTIGYNGYIMMLHKDLDFQEQMTMNGLVDQMDELNRQIELAVQAKNTPEILDLLEKVMKLMKESAADERIDTV